MNGKSNNNLASFKSYYEANVSSLTMFARRFVAIEVAEDIIQDLFLEIWDNLETKYAKLPSKSYLFISVRNRCFNIITREQVKRNYIDNSELEIRLLGLDYYDSYDKHIIIQEEMQFIYNEIDKLPEKCRETFKMSYLEERKNAEIAELLKISIRTVEHHLYLGLKTLREKLMTKINKNALILFILFFL